MKRLIALLILIAALSFGGFILARKLHYALAYEGMVRETIQEMVEQEALRGRPE